MCRIFFCVWKRVFAMTNVFSWQNSVSLWPASFCVLACLLLQVSLDFLLLHSSPYNEKDIFFGVLVLEDIVDLHRTIQFQLLQHYWLGNRLGSLWFWMVCFGNEQRSFHRFLDCPQVLHFRLFVDYESQSISSKGFLPIVVDIMVIWVKFIHSTPL